MKPWTLRVLGLAVSLVLLWVRVEGVRLALGKPPHPIGFYLLDAVLAGASPRSASCRPGSCSSRSWSSS